ncbi:MAG: hypothetical protein QF673_02460, partial [Candidatus Hydrothermarchaeota archaeon]|nr:hypothetical protein [Candidatus Hydrothermarchaeota archaeon]
MNWIKESRTSCRRTATCSIARLQACYGECFHGERARQKDASKRADKEIHGGCASRKRIMNSYPDEEII